MHGANGWKLTQNGKKVATKLPFDRIWGGADSKEENGREGEKTVSTFL